MAPAGGDLDDRDENEGPLGNAGMWQDKARPVVADETAIVEKIKVESARTPADFPVAARAALERLKMQEKCRGREVRVDCQGGIGEGRVIGDPERGSPVRRGDPGDAERV